MRILRMSLLAVLMASTGACVVQPMHSRSGPPPAVEEGPPPASGNGVLSGVVVDAQTHEGLSQVALDIAPMGGKPIGTAVTDAHGRFHTAELPPGNYAVRLRREKYNVVQASAEIHPGENETNYEMERR